MRKEDNQKVEELADLISNQNGETAADHLAKQLEIYEADGKKIRSTILNFVRSYKSKPVEQSNVSWLTEEFCKYPDLWTEPNELEHTATEIVENIELYDKARQDLECHFEKGLSRDSWLAKKIEQGASADGISNVGQYASKIDKAIDVANQNNIKVIYRSDGQLNQQMNLDGFIAEHHHANTFNIDAAAKGSGYRAEVLEPPPGQPYGKNSVDIVIKDDDGKIVRRYQSKFGADAKTTDDMLKKGDYRGQRKLVPKGQTDEVQGSTETIGIDGVQSKTLSKKEAKEYQRKAQEAAEAKQYDWNETSRIDIAKNIGKKACATALLSVGFQGARILGRRIWNRLTGKTNPEIEKDLQEFADSSIKSAASSGLAVAIAGGITITTKSGWLGKALKNTPAGRIANAVCIGVENVKILYKYSKGELTGEEALDQAGNATCSLIGGLAVGTKGASIGATIGTVLGPVGTVVGGVAGGIVGGIAGSTVGEAIYEGGKKIVSAVVDSVKSVGTAICDNVSSFVDGVSNFLFG